MHGQALSISMKKTEYLKSSILQTSRNTYAVTGQPMAVLETQMRNIVLHCPSHATIAARKATSPTSANWKTSTRIVEDALELEAGRGHGRGCGRKGHGNFKKRDKADVVCFKCRDKGHYAYECPQGKQNVNEVKESEMEIALTISKVASEEDTEVCETCVEHNNQEYSDKKHCTEELQGDIELKRRAYMKFYDSDNEVKEEFEIEEEEED